MMTEIPSAIIRGRDKISETISALTGDLTFPETAYHLPITYAVTGREVHTADAARAAYEESGKNTLIGAEIMVAEQEREMTEATGYTGFIEDALIRKLGYSLVDGSILGLCLILGTPQSADTAAAICRELQEKLMLTFLSGPVITVLTDSGVKVDLSLRLIPLGATSIKGVHFADILARVAMMFGGVPPGDVSRLISYAADRAKAFVIVFPSLSDEEIAFADALRILNIPIIQVGGYEGGEWLLSLPQTAVSTGMEQRGITVRVTAIPIPMACSPAFEGKSIRKEEMFVEFGGGRSPAFELLVTRPHGEVTDGKVTLIGPDVDQLTEGSAVPLGIIIEVAGKQMKSDYEPVLERRIHNFINYGEGSWHVAQRDLIWVRITKEAVANNLKITDLGKLLAAKFRMDFESLLEAVQVTLITDKDAVTRALEDAEAIYKTRDERIAGLKDEDVSLYYSCILCQTFAPNHVCIITPERPALCGAITWLDGKTAYEISPSGANQPVEKGTLLSAESGEYEGVNRFVKKASHGEIQRCVLYSIMDAPMTCCGCFEAIAMILPETNGVMVVTREFRGDTPCGMTFSTLAGTIGGGAQTPGFIGISKSYLTSDRFLQAEGGIQRVVWMPAHLKEEIRVKMGASFHEKGFDTLFSIIADETDAVTLDELLTYLESVSHPALSMPSLF